MLSENRHLNKLKVSSIRPESTIDYPGKFGPTIFTQGCNFRCGFCHNPDLALKKDNNQNVDLDRALKLWAPKITSEWYNGITITGGEPTLQPGLEECIRRFKDLGLAVKLDTNGTNPEILKSILEKGLLDYVAMDIKGPPALYPRITGIEKNYSEKVGLSMGILATSGINYELRTTVIPYISEGGEISWMNAKEGDLIGSWIAHYNKNVKYYVQRFKSRDKGEIVDERLSKNSLDKINQETPRRFLEEFKRGAISHIPNIEIRD